MIRLTELQLHVAMKGCEQAARNYLAAGKSEQAAVFRQRKWEYQKELTERPGEAAARGEADPEAVAPIAGETA